MGYKIGSKLAKMLLITLILIIIFSVSFSIYIFTNPDYPIEEYYTSSGTHVTIQHDTTFPTINLYVCTPVLFVLTILSFFYWLHRKRYDKLIDDLPSYVKMYRRAKIEQLARSMKISMKEAESLLQVCVKKGTVKGHFDHSTGEFVTEGTQFIEGVEKRRCPNCGAPLDTGFLEGEEIRCEYCKLVFIQDRQHKDN